MHRLRIFVVVGMMASVGSTMALPQIALGMQPSQTPSTPATPTAEETGFTAGGKIILGLEGRGNYRKPKKDKQNDEKNLTESALKTAATESNFRDAMQPQKQPKPNALVRSTSAALQAPVPATTVPAPAASAPQTKSPEQSLRSDRSQAKPQQAAAAPAVLPLPAIGGATNQPLMLAPQPLPLP